MCLLESKIKGGYPSFLIIGFRVKTFGYDSPRTNLRVLEEDPKRWPRSCQDSVQNQDVESSPCRGPDTQLASASRDFNEAHCLKINS